ncbi:hypothetical protein B0H63DRAFT_483224 [Podospora didyma]|uniref:Kinetochore protein Sos7 coiled-coil domain-containing protein n=1 Tax=Podospora didyma TaxID=330526 RepID=A0AAE0K854_9PEZI|nr:hypothetical protein B0H63DRAFT_483224 [Podospora didyma]
MARPRSPVKPTTNDALRAAKVLRALEDVQSSSGHEEITIIKISEPISTAAAASTTNEASLRTSDASNSSLDTPTPASLEADLAHYRELFAKLRFSYVEQVTKEKFIRAIVGDPPQIVTPQENADLEAENVAAKQALKRLKTEVADMVSDLEARGRELAGRYERVQAETASLRELPARMAVLEAEMAKLKHEQGGHGVEGGRMPLAKTVALADARRGELLDLERQLDVLSSAAPRKRKEMERLKGEVAALEVKRANTTAAAREAKRRRENAAGGVEDELEAKGRWYRATETALRQMLDIQQG